MEFLKRNIRNLFFAGATGLGIYGLTKLNHDLSTMKNSNEDNIKKIKRNHNRLERKYKSLKKNHEKRIKEIYNHFVKFDELFRKNMEKTYEQLNNMDLKLSHIEDNKNLFTGDSYQNILNEVCESLYEEDPVNNEELIKCIDHDIETQISNELEIDEYNSVSSED